MKLIAFDSGLERTGWAVFEKGENKYALTMYDCIITPRNTPIQRRINTLSREVRELVKRYRPEVFVLEQLFFFANKKTVIQVAQAQGAVLDIAGEHNIHVEFLTPSQIKMSLTGYGVSDKKAVQKMVQMFVHLDPIPKHDDTIDAIACGLTYCTMSRLTL